MKVILFCALTITSPMLALGQGHLLWNEAMHGPLGQTFSAPTSLGTLFSGTNSILGSVEATPNEFGWILANDYFTFQVPGGLQVQTITLTVNQQILVWLGSPIFGTEIGYRYTSTSENLIPFFGGSPLPAATYGMYMSDDNLQALPTAVSYRLDFVLTAVPEPSTWALLGLGGALFWSATRRRRK